MCSTCILLQFFKFAIVFFKYVFKKALSGDFIPITKDFSLLTICELIDTSVAVTRSSGPTCSCSKDGWCYPGGVLGISSDGDDRRIFLGLKFSIPGFFWVRKFG